jgi:hypothetical protein
MGNLVKEEIQKRVIFFVVLIFSLFVTQCLVLLLKIKYDLTLLFFVGFTLILIYFELCRIPDDRRREERFIRELKEIKEILRK